ncbi:MAG: family 43 glycosylhydrolase [Oscillospiraceae bacterium]|nr:family 43 glycosylhydrolase [Oscillospiraceae bacterium]
MFYNESDETFYMYYSARRTDGDDFSHRLAVATATDPLGPFTFLQSLQDSFWAIDPHMVMRNENGTDNYYLFYAQKKSSGDTVIYMVQCSDPVTPDWATAKMIADTTLEEEKYPGGSYCIEGPYYYEKGGIGYLMYSGGAWESAGYYVGYSTWDIAGGDGTLANAQFVKPSNYRPIISRDSLATGMGHHSVYTNPVDGKTVIVYHGRPSNLTGYPAPSNTAMRRLHITEMTVENGELVVHRPTVRSVTVTPDTLGVQKGGSQQFIATVDALAGADDTVTWSVSGNNSVSTAIDGTGNLSIAADETAATLTVMTSVHKEATTPHTNKRDRQPTNGNVKHGHLFLKRRPCCCIVWLLSTTLNNIINTTIGAVSNENQWKSRAGDCNWHYQFFSVCN